MAPRTGEVRPAETSDLLEGLALQLALADRLGYDLVAIRIAEAMDCLTEALTNGPLGENAPVIQ